MKQVEERYISLLTDFGFKRIFGTAMNKDLLICFLNSLFNGRQVVKDVSYLNPEHVGDVYTDRKAIFDVYCEGEEGASWTDDAPSCLFSFCWMIKFHPQQHHCSFSCCECCLFYFTVICILGVLGNLIHVLLQT